MASPSPQVMTISRGPSYCGPPRRTMCAATLVLQVVAPRERQPAIGFVLFQGLTCGGDSRGRRRHVGIEVLHAQDVGVVAGLRRDAVDAEAGDVIQAPHAHRQLLSRSVAPLSTNSRRV